VILKKRANYLLNIPATIGIIFPIFVIQEMKNNFFLWQEVYHIHLMVTNIKVDAGPLF